MFSNCFYLFCHKMQFNLQEVGMLRRKSNDWSCTPYSFPECTSEPSSLIMRLLLLQSLFFRTASWFVLIGNGCVLALDRALQSIAWCIPLPHFIHLRSTLRSSHTFFEIHSLFFFSLPAYPSLRCTASSKRRFFP